MKLAIFDLDQTLIASDSDRLWGEFMSERGHLDAAAYRRANDAFYEDYLAGRLDIDAFLAFQLKPLGQHRRATLERLRADYLQHKVKPLVLPAALDLVAQHRRQGHELLIITATNRFVAEPIAALFGIDNLIACEPEMRAGEYTGRASGIPSFAAGKVRRLRDWLAQEGRHVSESWFYSDSHNDLPLLGEVDHPVTVDPDETLKKEARKAGWPVISLRG